MWFFVKAGVTDEDQPLKNSRYWSTGAIKKNHLMTLLSFSIRESALKRVINNRFTGNS